MERSCWLGLWVLIICYCTDCLFYYPLLSIILLASGAVPLFLFAGALFCAVFLSGYLPFSAFNDCVKRCIRSVSYYFLLPASSSLSSIPTSTTLPTITPSTCIQTSDVLLLPHLLRFVIFPFYFSSPRLSARYLLDDSPLLSRQVHVDRATLLFLSRHFSLLLAYTPLAFQANDVPPTALDFWILYEISAWRLPLNSFSGCGRLRLDEVMYHHSPSNALSTPRR